MGRDLSAVHEEVDRCLALKTKEGRNAAHRAVMAALATFEVPGRVPEGAELFMRLGDVYAEAGDFKTALRAYSDAVACPGAVGNEHLHLRLGKARFELGDEAKAADELCRAFMGGGRELFAGEDPKYFEFLKTKIDPPAGEEW